MRHRAIRAAGQAWAYEVVRAPRKTGSEPLSKPKMRTRLLARTLPGQTGAVIPLYPAAAGRGGIGYFGERCRGSPFQLLCSARTHAGRKKLVPSDTVTHLGLSGLVVLVLFHEIGVFESV